MNRSTKLNILIKEKKYPIKSIAPSSSKRPTDITSNGNAAITFVNGIGSGSAKRKPWMNIIKPVIFLKI
jgi:hypothetical protein